MVYIVVENLLSTCKNRKLYEALWFLAFSRNNRKEILFENESIDHICNELIDRIRSDNIDARSFVVSTNLVYGTIRLYQAQIDKLYDQAKFALQSCSATFYQMEWLSEMTQVTSTPFPRTQKSTQKSKKSAVMNKSVKKPVVKKNVMDDFDMIESMFNMLEKDVEMEIDTTVMPSTSTGRRGRIRYDTGIDPTMANDVFAITMQEPTSLLTSGYQTMVNEDEGFGDQMGEEFMALLKDTAETVMPQSEAIQTTSGLLTSMTESRKRIASIADNSTKIKKRRLTYMNNVDEESIDKARNGGNINIDQSSVNFDIYDQPMVDSPATFNENCFEINDKRNSTAIGDHSMIQKTFESMDIDFEPSVLNTTNNNDSTLKNNSEMQNLSPVTKNIPETMQVDTENNRNIENLSEFMQIESQMVLDKIRRGENKRQIRKSKTLAVDKNKIISKDAVKKSIEHYKDRMTGVTPFSDFQRQIHYNKSCCDVLFSNGSARLKKSKLHYLYARNMVKVPEKLAKKKAQARKSIEMDNDKENNEPSTSKAALKSAKGRKLNVIHETVDILPPFVQDLGLNTPPTVAKYNLRQSTRSGKILTESNIVEEAVREILKESDILQDILPKDFSLMESINNNCDQSEQQRQIELDLDVEMPPAIIENGSRKTVSDGLSEMDRLSRKKVLKNLSALWKRKDPCITMEKICMGMQRTEAARTFFELLLLTKNSVIELNREPDCLTISHVTCKISSTELAKELRD